MRVATKGMSRMSSRATAAMHRYRSADVSAVASCTRRASVAALSPSALSGKLPSWSASMWLW